MAAQEAAPARQLRRPAEGGGNQNVHLLDDTTVVVKIGRKESSGRSGNTVTRTAVLHLARMKGNRSIFMRQVAEICANKAEPDRISVSFSINDTHVSVTFDPADLPHHPQRRRPVVPIKDLCLGIDLNPNWNGIAAAANSKDPSSVADSTLLEHALVKLDMPKDSSSELVREALAAVCDHAISMARNHRCGTIVLEKGLGRLRSSGRSRTLNRLLNHWARSVRADADTPRPTCRDRRARGLGGVFLDHWIPRLRFRDRHRPPG